MRRELHHHVVMMIQMFREKARKSHPLILACCHTFCFNLTFLLTSVHTVSQTLIESHISLLQIVVVNKCQVPRVLYLTQSSKLGRDASKNK